MLFRIALLAVTSAAAAAAAIRGEAARPDHQPHHLHRKLPPGCASEGQKSVTCGASGGGVRDTCCAGYENCSTTNLGECTANSGGPSPTTPPPPPPPTPAPPTPVPAPANSDCPPGVTTCSCPGGEPCQFDYDCPDTTTTTAGTCAKGTNSGLPCVSSDPDCPQGRGFAECTGGGTVTVPPSAGDCAAPTIYEGAACPSDGVCAPFLACHPTLNKCTNPRSPPGGHCDPPGQGPFTCADGLVCDGDGTCHAIPYTEEGEDCSAGQQPGCAPGLECSAATATANATCVPSCCTSWCLQSQVLGDWVVTADDPDYPYSTDGSGIIDTNYCDCPGGGYNAACAITPYDVQYHQSGNSVVGNVCNDMQNMYQYCNYDNGGSVCADGPFVEGPNDDGWNSCSLGTLTIHGEVDGPTGACRCYATVEDGDGDFSNGRSPHTQEVWRSDCQDNADYLEGAGGALFASMCP